MLAVRAVGRSIPAYAGEPRWRPSIRFWWRVYPRVCGGTHNRRAVAPSVSGLSPRMRGNLVCLLAVRAVGRSIPAYAGEPRWRPSIRFWWRVYPRVCGGTGPPPAPARAVRGLSPRMRGNPDVLGRGEPAPGSIPAYAGEPASSRRNSAVRSVYPRVCGGTSSGLAARITDIGLSPRMRGNRTAPPHGARGDRSIPAYAGEPEATMGICKREGVYPRVCGGTAYLSTPCSLNVGLSPRMRGNRSPKPQKATPIRSIPAYAGEPERNTL